MPTEKIQKVLANAGIASRRTIEQWITAGRIRIDGELAKLGDRIALTPRTKITIDGKPLKLRTTAKTTRVILYHKPEGEICSRNDPEGRPTVFDHLPKLHQGRWVAIGRLDFNTLGLLLFTNNGELANRLMHPSYEVEREYAVRVLGKVDQAMLTRLQQGVQLEDGMAKFENIIDVGGEGSNHWYHVTVKEGKNRLVRRLWESQHVAVSRLIRIRYGDIILPRSLRAGKWQELDEAMLAKLNV